MNSTDPFDTLGVPARFDISPSDIERAYLIRMAAAHPDHAPGSGSTHDGPANADDAETEAAASRLNEARLTLKSAERRASALLARLGGPSAADQNDLPEGFLLDIMQMRQELEAAVAEQDKHEIVRLRGFALSERSRYDREIETAFAALGAQPEASALSKIRTTLNAWRYIERMIEQMPSASSASSSSRSSSEGPAGPGGA